MKLFKKKTDEEIAIKKESVEERRKKLENVLALQKRHPFLDRFLMLAGIAAIIIIAIPFIYISFELSIFNMIGDGFDKFMNGDEVHTGILEVFTTFGSSMVPIFQIPWKDAAWIFALIGTLLFIAIIVGLIYLVIIYIRDFITIAKGIVLMLKKNTESTSALIKEQVDDSKVIAGSAGSQKKTKKVKKKEEKVDQKAEFDEVDKKVDEIKKELEDEKKETIQPSIQTSLHSSKPTSYEDMSDDELNKLLGK